MRLCILASGNGSNFEAIQEAIMKNELDARICCVISDKKNAFIHTRAKNHSIPSHHVSFKSYMNKEAAEGKISEIIDSYNPDYIVCAGYMKILGESFVNLYPNMILNIHPSKLPKYKGLNALQQALNNHDTEVGVTVHYIDVSLDGGPIIKQEVFEINRSQSKEEIEAILHKTEHKLYVEVLKELGKEV